MKKKVTLKNKLKVKWRKFLLKSAIYIFAGFFLFLVSMYLLIRFGAFGKIPGETDIRQIKNNTATNIYSVDNDLLGRYYYQNRSNVTYAELPKSLVYALVATEDARFYKHNGVDTRSLVRVAIKTILLSNRGAGGGSTISQQLAKNLYPRKRFGKLTIPVAKIKEMVIAKRIENIYEKNEIIELYLNTVPFAGNCYGIETASLTFFHKKPSELRVEEAAVLVGMLKANSTYNPATHKDASYVRRNVVLKQMVRYGYMTQDHYESLKDIPISLNYHKMAHDEGPAPYFREHLRHEASNLLKNIRKKDGSSYNLYADGLKIYTTINAQMQQMAEASVKEHMSSLQKIFDRHWKGKEPWRKNVNLASLQIEQSERYQQLISSGFSKKKAMVEMRKKQPSRIFTWNGEKDTIMSPLDSILHHFQILQTGVLVMNGQNGDILAWVGGAGYKYFKYDHIKAKRQVGSTFKPIVYTAALIDGKKPCAFYKNDSVVYEDYNNWCPKNSNHKYGGYYSMKGALANSVNTVSAQLILETGIENTIDLAHKMGVTSNLPEVPSLALGTGEVSLYEMVNAYCTFLSKGKKVEPRLIRRIEDAEGHVLYADNVHVPTDSVFSEEIAQKMLAMLKGVVNYGSARSLRSIWGLKTELAGKTGTTQDHTDGWFIALHPKIVVGTWVGGESPVVRFRNLTYGQGGFMALPICGRIMKKLILNPKYSYYNYSSFNIPDSIYAEFDCNNYNEDAKGVAVDIFNLDKDIIQDFIQKLFRKRNRKNKE